MGGAEDTACEKYFTPPTLTKTLAEAVYHSDSVITAVDAGSWQDEFVELMKGTFKEWLKTVNLPQYYNPDGQCCNATESLRKLLVTLVDEP